MSTNLMTNVFDRTRHPANASNLLTWLLWRWGEEPRDSLMIITPQGTAEALNNRIRVRLAEVRTSMRRAKKTDIQHFGFNTRIMGWDTIDGRSYEALCLTRVVHGRHNIREAFNTVGAPGE